MKPVNMQKSWTEIARAHYENCHCYFGTCVSMCTRKTSIGDIVCYFLIACILKIKINYLRL